MLIGLHSLHGRPELSDISSYPSDHLTPYTTSPIMPEYRPSMDEYRREYRLRASTFPEAQGAGKGANASDAIVRS